MSVVELAVKEAEARQRGDIEEATRLQAARWQVALGMVFNTENTGHKPVRRNPAR